MYTKHQVQYLITWAVESRIASINDLGGGIDRWRYTDALAFQLVTRRGVVGAVLQHTVTHLYARSEADQGTSDVVSCWFIFCATILFKITGIVVGVEREPSRTQPLLVMILKINDKR